MKSIWRKIKETAKELRRIWGGLDVPGEPVPIQRIGVCTRDSGHDGPCNGYPRDICGQWNELKASQVKAEGYMVDYANSLMTPSASIPVWDGPLAFPGTGTEDSEDLAKYPGTGVELQVIDKPTQVGTLFYAKTIGPRPLALFDCIYVHMGQVVGGPIRFKCEVGGNDVFGVILQLRPSERAMILGVHRFRAEQQMLLTAESQYPFIIDRVEVKFMNPDFRREDGLVIFNDPYYQPIPESEFRSVGEVHHRKVFGPGKDVGY